VSYMSWLEYLMASTPPTISSSTFTPSGIFGITIANFSCVRDIPYTLLSAHAFFFPCGDDTPTYGMPWCSVSCSFVGSRCCCAESMTCLPCCGPFPLDASDYVLSASSSGCLASCARFFSSSNCVVVGSYSGV
jgi:hypothetical protein